MKRHQLTVEKRTVLGKQVKKLRREGLMPGNIYGKDVKSTAVSVRQADFDTIYKEVGETGLLDLRLGEETRPVLIKNLQMNHITRTPLHVDFYQVNLKEKVKTMVPLEIVGEPKAVSDKLGLLLEQISEIEVEALPADLPEKIEVKVENLAAVGDQITVADLKIPADVTVLTDSGQVVVKIDELVSKETQVEAAAEAAAAEAAKEETAEAQGAEGANAGAGEEAKSEEAPKEKAKPEEK